MVSRDRGFLARERALQQRDGPPQQALDWLVGQALRILGPADRDRLGQVERIGGFAHDAPLRCTQPLLVTREAPQPLGEELDYVVALNLVMHQHVEPVMQLLVDRVADLLAHRLPVERAEPEGLVRVAGCRPCAGTSR